MNRTINNDGYLCHLLDINEKVDKKKLDYGSM